MEYDYVPEHCVWELTLSCNMRCMHCGSMAGISREKELTIEKCLDVADELLDLGCSHVTLIGGEVFLFKGWDRIARKLSKSGAKVNIVTNAALLGDKQIAQIEFAQLVNVGISLDGIEKNHNKIRNSARSFHKVLNAFELLGREHIPIAVVTSLLDFNFCDLNAIYDLLVSYNIATWQIQIASAMGNMATHRNILLNPAKVPLVTSFIKEKNNKQEIRICAGDNIGYYDENEPYLRILPGVISAWLGCQAGLRVVGIDSVGNVRGCQSLYSGRFIEGNLLQESLKEIWYKEGNFSYNRQFNASQLSGACAECDMGRICRGGCRGSCYFTTDSYFENVYCCYPRKKSLTSEFKINTDRIF